MGTKNQDHITPMCTHDKNHYCVWCANQNYHVDGKQITDDTPPAETEKATRHG